MVVVRGPDEGVFVRYAMNRNVEVDKDMITKVGVPDLGGRHVNTSGLQHDPRDIPSVLLEHLGDFSAEPECV
jgi:hypothetical protein